MYPSQAIFSETISLLKTFIATIFIFDLIFNHVLLS